MDQRHITPALVHELLQISLHVTLAPLAPHQHLGAAVVAQRGSWRRQVTGIVGGLLSSPDRRDASPVCLWRGFSGLRATRGEQNSGIDDLVFIRAGDNSPLRDTAARSAASAVRGGPRGVS